MEQAKHTPGHLAAYYDEQECCWMVVDSDKDVIACVDSESNARLIAAAPELLSLLKEARSTLEMWKDVAPAVSLCADIDKAIAKATGASND